MNEESIRKMGRFLNQSCFVVSAMISLIGHSSLSTLFQPSKIQNFLSFLHTNPSSHAVDSSNTQQSYSVQVKQLQQFCIPQTFIHRDSLIQMSPLGVCDSRRWLKFSLIVLVKVFLFKKTILLITSSLHFHAVFVSTELKYWLFKKLVMKMH